MTVENTTSSISYTGNGITTAFPTVFEFGTGADLVVELTDAAGTITAKALTTDYTVGGGNGAAGTVTMVVAPAAGETLVIFRDTDRTQGTDLVNNTAMQAEVVEAALDKLTRMIQEVRTETDRSVKLLRTAAAAGGIELPDPVSDQVLVGTADGRAWENRRIADLSGSAIALPLPVAQGGTGGTTRGTGRAGLGTVLSGTRSRAASFTVTAADSGAAFLCDSTAGDITVTLPTAADAGDGFSVTVKKIAAANSVTITPDGDETIDNGTTSVLIAVNAAVMLWCDGRAWYRALVTAAAALPRGFLSGLTLSNSTTDPDHDIDIAIGDCRDDSNASNMALPAAMTKRIDAAWAAGDGNGGLDTGSPRPSTWYHVWLISDGAAVDAVFSTSASTPTLPAGYIAKRRIGSVKTDGSSNILGFIQIGSTILWKRPARDVFNTRISNTASLHTLSVPEGVRVAVQMIFTIRHRTVAVYLSSPDQDDMAVSIYFGTGRASAVTPIQTTVWTDRSARIRSRADQGTDLDINTLGWMDPTL